MTDIANAPTARPAMNFLVPRTMEEAMQFSTTLSKSDLVPKDFQGKAANILVAVQWGMELGLQPMQAMQSIAVINGRPSLWGDAVIGLVRASGLCEYIYEEVAGDGTSATCRTKRKGDTEEVKRTFTMADAEKAGLKGKQGPWSQYPKRMLQMRARSWCLRDVYPDVLRGVHVAEESQDIEKDVTPTGEIQIPQAKPAETAKPTVDAEIVQSATAAADVSKKPEPTAGATAETTKAAAGNGTTATTNGNGADHGTLASAGQLGLIRKKAEGAEIAEAEILREFKLEKLEGISVATGNLILLFLSDPAGYAGKKS